MFDRISHEHTQPTSFQNKIENVETKEIQLNSRDGTDEIKEGKGNQNPTHEVDLEVSKDRESKQAEWREWSEWSQCSKSCRLGMKTRKRICENPAVEEGRQFRTCAGPSDETELCSELNCPSMC